jgi:diguanylate cyclase (GGDEF)-like protein
MSTAYAPPAKATAFSPPPCSALLVRLSPFTEPEPPVELTGETCVVGREPDCRPQLLVRSVSRRHARIEFDGTRHVITDLGSTNGTFVNDRRLFEPRPLAKGDLIRFGDQVYKYLAGDDVEARYHEIVLKLTTTDALTGAFNKRFFLDLFDRELRRSLGDGTPLSVMMLDLDRFKAINDQYGHRAGDAALVEFARRTRQAVHGGELLARYGGEEFALLLPQTSLSRAAAVGERIRRAIAAEPVRFEAASIPLSVSIGVAGYDGHTVCDIEGLLSLADRLLYDAKNGGRNQVRRQGDLAPK